MSVSKDANQYQTSIRTDSVGDSSINNGTIIGNLPSGHRGVTPGADSGGTGSHVALMDIAFSPITDFKGWLGMSLS